MAGTEVQNLAILGSTGSVGVNTLDVVRRNTASVRVRSLTARSNLSLLLDQCEEFRPDLAVTADESAYRSLVDGLRERGLETSVACGPEGLCQAATLSSVDTVMAAIVGSAGLESTISAAEAGKRLLLANKESAVMAGRLLTDAVRQGGAELIPIDSEHNAVFQCLPGPGVEALEGVKKVILTASGGPFLDAAPDELDHVTPDQACAHPKWRMGRKISVDSATLMNKGLELIEACCLFGLPPDRVDVLIHPQSIVHSLVQYRDGSTLAQLGNPDMRTPIAHALGWPARIESGAEQLDLVREGLLEFREPDLERFPCLGLAMKAARDGGGSAIVLNAANEIAVAAFLQGTLPFRSIAAVVDAVLAQYAVDLPDSIAGVLDIDRNARELAREKTRDFAL